MTDRSRAYSALNRPDQRFTPRSLAKFLASCLLFSSLAVALSGNASARALGSPAQQPAQAMSDAGNKADGEKEALPLEPGKAINRILAGADSHTYQIRLSAGQFVKVIVEQQGIDVVAELSWPGAEHIAEFDGEVRSRGQELVWFVAVAEGAYRLKVRATQKNAPTAGYEIRIEELRDATGDDFALHEARKLLKRASKLIDAGKYEEALPLVESSREIRERVLGPEHLDVAEALYVLSVLCWNRREYARTELLYQQALAIREKALGPDHPDVALVLNDLANLYRDSGNYARAEALCQRALDVMEKALGPEHLRVATVLNNLALVYWNSGEYAKAEPLHQRSLAIVEKVLGPENTDVARSLNNLATLYFDRGFYLKAEKLYQRALAIFEKSLGPHHLNVASSLENLASVYNKMAEYAKAEPLYQRSLAIWEKALGPDHPEVAISLNNLAILYRNRGNDVKAESLYLRALAIREKALRPEHPSVATSLNNLAVLYEARGDYANAEPLYQRALSIREKALGQEHALVGNSIYNLAFLYHEKGDYAKAEQLYERALNIREKALGAFHTNVASSIKGLAVLYRDKGEYAKAEPLLQRALAIKENALGIEHPSIVVFLDDLAMLYAAKGDFAKAVAVQARANSVGERNLALNLATGSERQKLAYLALFTEQTHFTLSLHSQGLPQDPQALDLAFTTLLRRKGRGLEAMADTISAMRRHATPEDHALFDQLAEARSQLALFMLKESGTDKPETYQARLKSLDDKVEELESALSARRPDFRAQTQPVTLNAVQSAIPAGGALVEFAVYKPQDPRNVKNKLPPRYLAYLLAAQGRPKWTDLGEAAPINRAITAWRQALRDPRRTDVKRLARVVDEKVMRPVLALAQSGSGEIRRLLIAPDGLLNLVPFAALVDRQGRYLVEAYSISYLMSGRDLLRSPVRGPNNQDTVIVADPDYGGSENAIASRSRDVGLPAGLPQSNGSKSNVAQVYFPPLKGTAGEARALKTILPQATVFTRGQATEYALKQLHSPGILHVATHGFFLQDQEIRLVGARDLVLDTAQTVGPSNQPIENPLLRSGLALAGVNHRLGRADQGDDGVLTALEAAGLDLFGTKLVVLSACDTGVGEVKNGEGVFGLRRALSLAGSETQVMSLWPVSDLGARDLMIDYYKALERGAGRGDGLRRVQLEMLKGKGRRHPFYWASFIQSGEWANLEGNR